MDRIWFPGLSIQTWGTQVCGLAAVHGKDDIDGGFDLDGLTVEEVGAVAPGLDGVDGRALEHRTAGEDAEVGDGSGWGDGGGEGDCAGETDGAGDRWVGRAGWCVRRVW